MITQTSLDIKLGQLAEIIGQNKKSYHIERTLSIDFLDFTVFEKSVFTGDRAIIQGHADYKNFPIRELLELAKSNSGKNPNPRGLNSEERIVKTVTETLSRDPGSFHLKSSYITIWANLERYSFSDGCLALSLSFSSGQGLADGQHRLWSIWIALSAKWDLTDLKIPVKIIVGQVSNSEALENVLYASETKRHTLLTKHNAKGDFKYLKSKTQQLNWRVKYYENQPDIPNDHRCTVDHLLRSLVMLDFKKYDWNKLNYAHPISFALKTLSEENFQQAITFASRASHLLEDVVTLEQLFYEQICEELLTPIVQPGKTLFQYQILPGFDTIKVNENLKGMVHLVNNKAYEIKCFYGVVYPIISAYRLWLTDDYNWIAPFEKFSSKLMNRLSALFINDLIDLSRLYVEKQDASFGVLRMYVKLSENWRRLCAVSNEFKAKYMK